MILARLSDWRTAPGAVVVFGPTARSRAAAERSPVDPAPASFLQADHVGAYAARVRDGGEHRAWTGIATEIDGPLDREALARALTRLARTHEGFRSWFDLTANGATRHVVPSDDVEHTVVAEKALDTSSWDDALHVHMVEQFTADCRPDAWPGYSLGVVERADDFAIFWGCDHAFTDGASQIMVASELADLYAAELAEPGGPAVNGGLLPGPDLAGDFGAFAASERERAATYTPTSPEVVAWTELVAANGGRLPSFPLDLGLEPGQTAPVQLEDVDALTGDAIAQFDARCRAAGGRLIAGIFAAVAATEHELAGREKYFGVTVLGTRADGPYAMAQGWFCTFAPVAFDVAGHADFDSLIGAAHGALARGKAISQMPVHVALAEMIRTGVVRPESLGSPQLLSYLDLSWFPGVGRPGHDRGVHFTGAGRTANASIWVNKYPGRLQVGMQYPDTPEAHASTELYRQTLARIMRAAAAGEPNASVRSPAHAGHHG